MSRPLPSGAGPSGSSSATGALLDGLDAESCAAARDYGIAPSLVLDRGPWTPPADEHADTIGYLVLDGLMIHGLQIADRVASELIGRGDLLQPWTAHDGVSHGAASPTWRVVHTVTAAILDGRFARSLSRWPGIARNLVGRGEQRSRGLLVRTAIPQVRRADERLRLLFWDLADRWGRVTPLGVVLPLALNNGVIAQLAAMHRPTVSRTMTLLADRGEVVRLPDGGFLLDLALEPTGVQG